MKCKGREETAYSDVLLNKQMNRMRAIVKTTGIVHYCIEQPSPWRRSIRLPVQQTSVAKPFCLNNREGGTVNTDLLGFVGLMTSCSSGL